MDSEIEKTLKELVNQKRVVLFMKGNRLFPQCGFSAQVVKILKSHGAEFSDVNVLADPSVRQGIKEFSSWPTIPQLYVDGNFVGGCDIITELHENGELQKVLAQPEPQAS